MPHEVRRRPAALYFCSGLICSVQGSALCAAPLDGRLCVRAVPMLATYPRTTLSVTGTAVAVWLCGLAYSEHLASCKALGSASASAREGYEGPRDVTSLSLSASLTGLLGSIPGGPLTAAVLLEA
jgi:hypothetical protein